MKNLLFDFFCLMIRFSGFSFFVSRILTKRKVKIVVYHNPKEDIFKKHIKYLSKRYNFIFMDEFVEALINKDFTKIPPNSLCVTIDDGYKSNFTLVFPILKEFDIDKEASNTLL